jgi:hypothetical protein
VDFQMVDVNLVLRQMEGSGTKLNLVILDACRNNPFGGRGLRATGGGLAQMQAPEGTLISYATQPGNVAQDGDDGHSPYSKALAQTIKRGGLDIFGTFNAVGLAVKRSTSGSQQPWLSSSPIEGNFYFRDAPPAAAAANIEKPDSTAPAPQVAKQPPPPAPEAAKPAPAAPAVIASLPDPSSQPARDPGTGLTTQECSARYKAAKTDGTLNGRQWNDFRQTMCAAGAPVANLAPPNALATAPSRGAGFSSDTALACSLQADAKGLHGEERQKFRTACKALGERLVFPTAVSPQYSSEDPDKARMHTCTDQFNANKATNANGGLKWIEQDGGYSAECNRRLKG